MIKTVSILGSTGSVGCSTLGVIEANEDAYDVNVLVAGRNVEKLAEQAKAFNAKHAVIADDTLYGVLKDLLSGTGIEISAGRNAVIEAAGIPSDITMASIVGMAGLEPIMAALRNGKNVAIANKEPLVAAGDLVIASAKKYGAMILPVDSEHNAIFQVLEPENKSSIRRLILTGSGGPFRLTPMEELAGMSPAQAVAHPNWSMGAKLSVDSSTMVNKALEVIEAHKLFDMPPEQIDVVIHPQSIIHSMVEYEDGSILAQMGPSDMKVPIASALGWPKRIKSTFEPFDFTKISGLTFEACDPRRFPAINFAYDCMKQGQEACLAFNAADEVAVAAFLNGDIGYLDIFEIVKSTVEESTGEKITDLESILFYDQKVRDLAKARILKTTQSKRKVS
jgi:1-deoxy-D-xylulose-5-phosphate reductoisomerase